MTGRIPAGLLSAVLLILGAWLLVFSVTGVYGVDSGFDGPWGDRVAGAAAVVAGVARVSGSVPARTSTWLAAGVGLWLVLSPFVLDYGFGADTATAVTLDLLAGVAVAAMAVAEYAGARNPV